MGGREPVPDEHLADEPTAVADQDRTSTDWERPSLTNVSEPERTSVTYVPEESSDTTIRSPRPSTEPPAVRAFGPTVVTTSDELARAHAHGDITAARPPRPEGPSARTLLFGALGLVAITATTATITALVALRSSTREVEVTAIPIEAPVKAEPTVVAKPREPTSAGPSAEPVPRDRVAETTPREEVRPVPQDRVDKPVPQDRGDRPVPQDRVADTTKSAEPRVKGPELSDLPRLLQRELARRSLVLADVEPEDTITPLLERHRATLAARSPDAREAFDALVGAIRTLPLSAELVKRKLARTATKLSALPESIEGAQRVALEKRYFELRTRVRPQSSPQELEALVSEIVRFDAELERAGR